MSVAVDTRVPRHVSNYHGGPRSSSVYSRGRSSTGTLLERINAAEVRSTRPRSHSRSLVLREPHHHHHHHHRSVEDIEAEIRALEAESRANHLERKAELERELAEDIRDYSPPPDRVVVEERRPHHHHHRQPRDEVVLLDRSRSRPREEVFYERRRRSNDELVVYERSRSRLRDEYVVYKRETSPPRNIVRVEKDRKGRLALVRSAH